MSGTGEFYVSVVNVGAAEVEDDDEPFEQKMKRLTAELENQFAESSRLEAEIRKTLGALSAGD